MSDIDTTTEPEAEDTPLSWPTADEVVPDDQVTTEPEPEETDDETPAPEPDAPATPPAADNQQTFDRPYVEALRQENAGYRVRAKEYEDVFSNFNDDERGKFLDLASGLADESRHQEVAHEFIEIGRRILGHYGVEVPDNPAPDPNRPMTRAEYEAAERKREEERQVQANIEAMTKDIQGMGYELGSLDHYALLRAAQDSETGDLKAAHEAVQAWKKGIIDSFIAEHSKKAGAHLPTPPQTGAAPAEMPDELPADEAEAFTLARRQFNALLDAQ